MSELGYQVVDVEDAKTALSLIARGLEPELLLTDIVLPGTTNGHELARCLRDLVPGIGLVMMSAHDRGILEDAADLADTVLLEKPFTRELLAQTIRHELDSRRPDDERPAA